MIYIVDLDGTLCSNEKDYHMAKPFHDRIKKINELYDQGHKIHIDTARGSVTGKNHRQFTEFQLKRWGVKYNSLRTGVKLFGDFYLDDKALLDKEFFKDNGGIN